MNDNTTACAGGCPSATYTAVTLESFTATPYDGRVLLQWQTGFEVDNLGFNLYREQGGERTRINKQIIAGSALLVGAGTTLRAGRSYVWWDASAQSAEDGQYWLEAIDLNGQRAWRGPASLDRSARSGVVPPAGQGQATLLSSLGRAVARQLLTTPVARRAMGSTLTAARPQQQAPLAAQPAVKLSVRQEGWYRVTQPELLAAGLDPSVDPRLLHWLVVRRS